MARTATRVRRVAFRIGAVTLLGALLLPQTAAPASAGGTTPLSVTDGPISRWEVIQRAKSWTDAHVPYSMTGRHGGYRTDCSGFVSMAWHLDTALGGLTTAGLPSVADPIGKDDLAAGDILLMRPDESADGIGHVVLFVAWADPRHTAYEAMDEEGDEGARLHVLPYPYRPGYGTFHPYRYHNITDSAPGGNPLPDNGFADGGGWPVWPGTPADTACPAGTDTAPPLVVPCFGAVNTGSVSPDRGPSAFREDWGAGFRWLRAPIDEGVPEPSRGIGAAAVTGIP